jgi:hypothetical protein
MWQQTSGQIFTDSIQAENNDDDDDEGCGDRPLDSCLAGCFRGYTRGWQHIHGGNTVDVGGQNKT